jgi:hypothetical protein
MVSGRDDELVCLGGLRIQAGLLPVVQHLGDLVGHIGAAADGETASLAEVVLYVHHDERAGHRVTSPRRS